MGGRKEFRHSICWKNTWTSPCCFTQDEQDHLRGLSNVCTHRGFILAQHPARDRKTICGYHSRRFNLAGQMEHMPEFAEAAAFPGS